MALLQKGISKEIVSEVLEAYYDGQDESMAIQRLLDKKRFSAETATEEEKRKIYGYLMRKGFAYEDIRRVIR